MLLSNLVEVTRLFNFGRQFLNWPQRKGVRFLFSSLWVCQFCNHWVFWVGRIVSLLIRWQGSETSSCLVAHICDSLFSSAVWLLHSLIWGTVEGQPYWPNVNQCRSILILSQRLTGSHSKLFSQRSAEQLGFKSGTLQFWMYNAWTHQDILPESVCLVSIVSSSQNIFICLLCLLKCTDITQVIDNRIEDCFLSHLL